MSFQIQGLDPAPFLPLFALSDVPGTEARALLERQLAEHTIAYVHIHFARPGCFACRADRCST